MYPDGIGTILQSTHTVRSRTCQHGRVTYRLDITVEETHWMDGFNGLENLLAEPQGGAHGECSSGLTPPQVSQVPPLPQGGTTSDVISLNLHPMNSPTYCELHHRLTHKLHQKTVPNAKDWFATVLNTTASSYTRHICPNSPEAAWLHSWICHCARSQWTYRHGFYLKADSNKTSFILPTC